MRKETEEFRHAAIENLKKNLEDNAQGAKGEAQRRRYRLNKKKMKKKESFDCVGFALKIRKRNFLMFKKVLEKNHIF